MWLLHISRSTAGDTRVLEIPETLSMSVGPLQFFQGKRITSPETEG